MNSQQMFSLIIVVYFVAILYSAMYLQLINSQLQVLLQIMQWYEGNDAELAYLFSNENFRLDCTGKIVRMKKERRRPRFWMCLQSVSILNGS